MNQGQENIAPRPKPRIAYLLRMYPRFSQTFVVNEILELERQGADLRIVSLRLPNEGVFHESSARVRTKADYLPDRLSGQRTKLFRAQWKWLRSSPSRYGRAVRLLARHRSERWFELVQAVELLRWARKNRVDHVHVHFGTDEATVALLANMIGGLSYSLTLHAFDIFRDNVDKSLLATKINASRFTVTVCESNRRYMIDSLPNLVAEKIRVGYNGIDVDRFVPTSETRQPMTVFSVGRLIEKKGFRYLVDAMAILRKRGLRAECCIAGDGREQRHLMSQIKSRGLGDVVNLCGPLEQQVIRRHMQQAACFVLPCVQAKDGNVDALPTVLLESLACGCPTVSTKLSGIPEIMDDGQSGLLVEPEDSKALADAMERVLTDPELARKLSFGGRQRACERFHTRDNVGQLHRWLCEATGSPDSSSTSVCGSPSFDAPGLTPIPCEVVR